jgi:PIN domain nuclease of toxin-antitoxin system/antitoxin (DNA-binding transcriptional repressor) of toxin-antitoxin stability system
MITASIFEAKTNLSQLVRQAQNGEAVTITTGRDKTPVARLEAVHSEKKKRLGALETPGFTLTDAFFEPLENAECLLRAAGECRTGSLEWRRQVKVLLDTCTLLWAVLAPAALSSEARQIIADEENTILVSAASAWEIATKVRRGKLPGAEKLEREFLEIMDKAGYTMLPIDGAAALRAGRIPAEHRDPFDRMIAAQALGLDIPVLSLDSQLDCFAVRRIW